MKQKYNIYDSHKACSHIDNYLYNEQYIVKILDNIADKQWLEAFHNILIIFVALLMPLEGYELCLWLLLQIPLLFLNVEKNGIYASLFYF